jgi:arachidonate 15-lipoxygenase
MGAVLSKIGRTIAKAILFPILLLVVVAPVRFIWLLLFILPVRTETRDRWIWGLRKRFWNLLATRKFAGVKPAVIPFPGRLAWWRWILVLVFGKTLSNIGRVPFNRIFPSISITRVQVAAHEPADEWDAVMKLFTWVQVQLYWLFPAMQAGLSSVEADPYAALKSAYTIRHRQLFPAPVLPLELQGSPDLGALAVRSPYACYTHRVDDRHCAWDFSILGRYPHHAGLYDLNVVVLFEIDQGARVLRPVRIESELGVARPRDAMWPFAKTLALCAATNHLSLVRHFNGIHLASGAHLALATRNHLFPDHVLCRLLWPYIYRTLSSNPAVSIAQMAEGGDFSSVFSFTQEGLYHLFDETYERYRFIVNDPYEDGRRRGIRNAGFDTPAQDDQERLFNLFSAHVEEYLQIYYRTAAVDRPVVEWLNDLDKNIPGGIGPMPATIGGLARLIARFMYLVTVHHDHCGTFLWNYQLWAHLPPRLYRDGRRLPLDVYQRLVNANFNLNVKRAALMNDFGAFVSTEHGQQKAAKDVLARFQTELRMLEARWQDQPWHPWRIYPTMLEVNINP